MGLHWNYCVAKDGDGLLLINGKVYRVKNFEVAVAASRALKAQMLSAIT